MSNELKEKLKELQLLEEKYGLIMFRMGLTHLVDVGHRHMGDDEYVEETIAAIMAEGKKEKKRGEISLMTPEFQCELLRCAAELAKFSPWTLFTYIKFHVVIN